MSLVRREFITGGVCDLDTAGANPEACIVAFRTPNGTTARAIFGGGRTKGLAIFSFVGMHG